MSQPLIAFPGAKCVAAGIIDFTKVIPGQMGVWVQSQCLFKLLYSQQGFTQLVEAYTHIAAGVCQVGGHFDRHGVFVDGFLPCACIQIAVPQIKKQYRQTLFWFHIPHGIARVQVEIKFFAVIVLGTLQPPAQGFDVAGIGCAMPPYIKVPGKQDSVKGQTEPLSYS